MQKFLVYQSWWGMERRRPDGLEWSDDEKLEMIRDAGFDGISLAFFGVNDESRKVVDFIKAHDMSWQAVVFPKGLDDLKPVLDGVEEIGAADHVDVQPDVRPDSVHECIPYLERWRRDADSNSVPVYFETHRDRMTTDLFFTLQLLDCFPDLKLVGDLSHFVVGREFAWPISEENHALMHRIIDNCWAFHGRVASREQVQIQIGFPHHKEWLDLFLDWWEYGFAGWRTRAERDAILTFTCELGPREYAISGADGYELSDRWQEAQTLKDMIREVWRRIEDEEAKEADDG